MNDWINDFKEEQFEKDQIEDTAEWIRSQIDEKFKLTSFREVKEDMLGIKKFLTNIVELPPEEQVTKMTYFLSKGISKGQMQTTMLMYRIYCLMLEEKYGGKEDV